ncbi:addiction module antidote protein, HigA family [Acidiferrobacter sp. SPIII_3]|uniref:HigA family addiction module antitoxin n=1 Tax=Acidiferrobacter sp. SPIII_3 TaxID=1281578 RepID=UPI000D733FB7|nr:HigA family addiction module antitoxin [Acidiferrobacter sp. SPIII_3]AWP23189.1 addiction module antidote protein, HigA family [Acidiferrobacter sp. SPIII_3]
MTAKRKRLEPIHPGEILLEDFMKPQDISINRLARDIIVPPGRISAIVNGKRAITADTALRLGKYFGVSPQIWMGLQVEYDLRVAERTIGDEIAKRVQEHAA